MRIRQSKMRLTDRTHLTGRPKVGCRAEDGLTKPQGTARRWLKPATSGLKTATRPLETAKLLSAALGAMLLSGCHNYIPIEAPTPGSTVRVSVPVTSAVADLNNPDAPQASIEGVVVDSGDSITLAVTRRQEYGAFREAVRHDTITLDLAGVLMVEKREFSQDKSLLLGVGLLAGATGLALAAFGIAGGQQGGVPGDGNPNQSIIPLLTFTIGR